MTKLHIAGVHCCRALIVFAVLIAQLERVSADQVGNAVAQAGSVDTQLQDELKLANEAVLDAFATRDLWAMSQLWAKDEYISALFPAAASPAFGWDNVRKTWQYTFDHNRDIRLKSLAGFIKASGDEDGDTALIIDATQFEAFQTQTGQPVTLPGMLATKIFERRQGKWLLVHYHAHQPGMKPPTATDEESGIRPLVTTTDDEIRAADDAFYRALRSRDMEGMDKVWASTEDVTAIQPEGETPFFGRANVMASWKALFDHNRGVQIPRTTQTMIHISGNKAWMVGSFEAALVRRKTGSYVHLPEVLVTKLFVKEAHDWKLSHYHAHIGPLAHSHGQTPLLATAFNQELAPTRTIELDATEMTFGVGEIEVRAGEVIRFVVRNSGEARHEFGLASPEENRLMQALMRLKPDMIHSGDRVVTIEPGETKELIWRVPEKIDVEFSCNLLGHAEAGMRGTFKLVN